MAHVWAVYLGLVEFHRDVQLRLRHSVVRLGCVCWSAGRLECVPFQDTAGGIQSIKKVLYHSLERQLVEEEPRLVLERSQTLWHAMESMTWTLGSSQCYVVNRPPPPRNGEPALDGGMTLASHRVLLQTTTPCEGDSTDAHHYVPPGSTCG